MGTNGTPKQEVRSKRSQRSRRFGLRGRHLSASLFLHIAFLLVVAALSSKPADDYPITIAVLLIEEEIGTNGVDADSGDAAGAPTAATPAAAPAATASADAAPVSKAQPKAVARPNPKPAAPARKKAVTPSPEKLPEAKPITAPTPDMKPSEVATASTATSKNAEDGKEGQSSGTGQGTASAQSTGQANGQGTGSGTGEGRSSGSGGGKKGGAADDYLERVRRSLERFKRYPDEARKLKQEGTVQVSFVLARDGSVLSAQVTGGSGFVLLDQAALDIFNAASPLPPVPNYVEGETVKIGMPISFSLSFFGRIF